MIKTIGILTAGAAAIVIDEKTGVSIGTLVTVITAALWIGRKFQNFLDQFQHVQEFIDESKKWRETVRHWQESVNDEQRTQRERQEQILRHQEQARQRHEKLMQEVGAVSEQRKAYAEVMVVLDGIKHHLGIDTTQFHKKDIKPSHKI